jgi:hypothetical protein
MTLKDLVHLRLLNQQIVNTTCKSPYDVVSTLGAVQAQDYYNALWAIGLRLPKALESDIEEALNTRSIVRTWPMRGTLHFVAAEDAKWMLQLMTPRIIAKSAGIYRQSELNDQIFKQSKDLFIKALEGGKSLIRDEMYQILNNAGISSSGQRGLHILGHHAQNGLICFGKRAGKQQTFVLLDEWIANFRTLSREESLAEIALRYFKSHGPATLNDFVWWTGLKVSEAKEAVEMTKSFLQSIVIEGETYWMNKTLPDLPNLSKTIHLLPAYDEFLIAYSDRSASLHPANFNSVFTKNGIFNPTIIRGGKVLGAWKRTITKDKVLIELNAFDTLSQSFLKAIAVQAKKFAYFVGKTLEIKSDEHL